MTWKLGMAWHFRRNRNNGQSLNKVGFFQHLVPLKLSNFMKKKKKICLKLNLMML